jgi:ankyrin repeat protein
VKVQDQSDDSFTPLHAAVSTDLVTAKVLHEAGADVMAQSKDGSSVLYEASLNGQVKIVEWLLSLEVKIQDQTNSGLTPLHAAVTKDLTAAKVLYEAGADIMARSKSGRSVLFEASASGQAKIVEWLLSLGAKVQDQNDYGSTPLHGVVTEDLATAKVLHEAGADITARSKTDRSVLYEASISGQVKIVEWLLSLGAEVQDQNDCGFMPLHGAVTKDLATVKVLHEAGADVMAQSKNGSSVLHSAVMIGQSKIIKWLLPQGSNVRDQSSDGNDTGSLTAFLDKVDGFGHTALHFPIYQRHVDIIELLIMNGADADIPDGYGRTCRDWLDTIPVLKTMASELPKKGNNTAPEIAVESLFLSVRKLTEKLLDNNGEPCNPGYHELGHCLSYLQHPKEAMTAYELQILAGSDDPRFIKHNAFCDVCKSNPVVGFRHVCTTCPNCDLCDVCRKQQQIVSTLSCCSGHDFLQIPGPSWTANNSVFVNDNLESRLQWLERLKNITQTSGVLTKA